MINVILLDVAGTSSSIPLEYVILIVYIATILLIGAVGLFRISFMNSKNKYRSVRSIGNVNGGEVCKRILAENDLASTEVKPGDGAVKYWYKSSRDTLFISNYAYYASGLYEVMRAAQSAFNVVQCSRYERLSRVYAHFSWLLEASVYIAIVLWILTFYLVGLIGPYIILLLLANLLIIVVAVIMYSFYRRSAAMAYDWLLSNGVVAEENKDVLKKVEKIVSSYNMINVLTVGASFLFVRSSMMFGDQ